MEIGAVKQAFNNELILFKKNLNQAKTQIIHKLTRKAKQLTEKKAPDALKEKLKRKAENAVKEVLVMKKVKARDVGRFIVTHTGKLQDYLNKPQVDNDKACARILLHKAMQEKYKFIRNRFSNIPIKDLFMSRNERLKLKKEEKMKKKEKRDRKKAKGLVNAKGDWDVEDVVMKKVEVQHNDDEDDGGDVGSEVEEDMSGEDGHEAQSGSELGSEDDESIDEASVEDESVEGFKISFKGHSDESESEGNEIDGSEDENSLEEEEAVGIGKFAKLAPNKSVKKFEKANTKEPAVKSKKTDLKSEHNVGKPSQENINYESKVNPVQKTVKVKSDKKQKDNAKNKNLHDKIVNKKFKKGTDDTPEIKQKIVDPFFVTATGENYMSIAEPRPPDEIKEVHKQGNRKLRRAVMFGHVPKVKPRQEFKQDDNRFNRQNGFNQRQQNSPSRKNNKFNNKSEANSGFNRFENTKKSSFNDRNDRRNLEDSKPEKLHPSWEAKKKQSGILPFQGKKIVFDQS